MTSDAKIGLLLGLIFIFVIAFVINGLPSLRPPISKVTATPISPGTDEDFSGVAGKTEQAATNWTEQLDQSRTAGDAAQTVVEEPKAAEPEPKPVAPESPLSPPAQPRVAAAEGVRSILTLPAMGKLLDQLTPTLQKDQVTTINVDTPARPPEPPVASGRSTAAAVPPSRAESASEPKQAETPTKATDTRVPAKPATAASKPANIPGATVYTTVAGDNLAVIAKKVYGAEEGNRVANIDRIFRANEATLKSADKVLIGMKLVIPPLPKVSAATPADVLPATLFEKPTTIKDKVQSLAKPAAAATSASTPDARWYTVQDGDKLWKIAATQLGAGSRWDEIYKLNPDVLTSQDSLKVGTRLRLPAK
jgi:nucleoid-associated protein YgaU